MTHAKRRRGCGEMAYHRHRDVQYVLPLAVQCRKRLPVVRHRASDHKCRVCGGSFEQDEHGNRQLCTYCGSRSKRGYGRVRVAKCRHKRIIAEFRANRKKRYIKPLQIQRMQPEQIIREWRHIA